MDGRLRTRISGQVRTGRSRARAWGLPAPLTLAEWMARLEASGGRCARCGGAVGLAHLELDHIMPIRNGGAHAAANVQPLCTACNHRKLNYNPDGSRTPLPRLPRLAVAAPVRCPGTSPTGKRFDLQPTGLYEWRDGAWQWVNVPDWAAVLR